MRRSVLRAIAAVLVIGAGAAAFVFSDVEVPGSTTAAAKDSAADPKEDEPTPVELAPVRVGSISTYLTATANLVADHQVVVVSETSGRVGRVLAREGQVVKAGELLVVLDDREAQLAAKTARIKADHARTAHARVASLAGEKWVSAEELEKAKTDLAVAEQELTVARFELGQKRVKAPIGGRVTLRSIEQGQFVREGDDLVQITSFDRLVARIHVPERDAMRIEPDREVDLVLQANPDLKFTGAVRHVSNIVDPQSGTVELTIEVDHPPTEVRSGSFVGLRMLSESHPQALWLPREAVLRGPRGAHVFVVDGGTAHLRPVVTGVEEGGRLQIVEGLGEGERVVLSGHGNLEDGDAVTILTDAETG